MARVVIGEEEQSKIIGSMLQFIERVMDKDAEKTPEELAVLPELIRIIFEFCL
ncbi:MAG: hypothetical protein IJP88_04415 [Synergistaceae bacterium]|nr:hypothetical protein [Synergistaceae bacterium]MBR0096399.1 hypothetical protein [Synergistaceae bacterium]